MSRSPRVTLSRRQKRIQRQQYVQKPNTVTRPSPGVASKVCTVSGDFRQSQRDDPSLKNAWQQALNPEEHATNATLTDAHYEQLLHVIEGYRDVFSKLPGRTHLAEHPIRTKNETISRQRPYRVPEVKHKAVGGHDLGQKKAPERVRGSEGQAIKAAQQEPGLREERENEVLLQGQYNQERKENTRE
ncbi:hypothetical protein NDU88_002026 [Pleurodeles waltl]|uniref:Uncharacterized protein n=1 Tax=Pleurodeles waltl TaxID=8319 RepID=A0AAV7LBG4_PLEWA|nr:hypothetical protein NDU88_002026 [Pleurodeles waltl]